MTPEAQAELSAYRNPETKTLYVPGVNIQRCLVKAIALHGLGLNVYAGEDLPTGETDSVPQSPSLRPVTAQKLKHPAIPDNGFTHPEPLTPNQLRYIKRLIEETGTDVEQLLAFFDVDALDHIPKNTVNRVIQVLESHRIQEAA